MRIVLLASIVFTACGQMPSPMIDSGTQDTDAGTTADAGLLVTVRFTDGGSASVALEGLATTMIAGKAVVRFDSVIAAADPTLSTTGLKMGFRASDGFDPASRANCMGVVPVPAANFSRGGIEPATRNLTWDDMLGYPGCLYVRDCVDFVLVP